MSTDRSAEYLVSLVRELCKLPHETEWVEFKVNDAEPQMIGEYLSALANAAALAGKAFAYLLWGVADADHALVGSTFDPHAAKVGNEELESWLLRLLEPRIDFRFFSAVVDGQRVVLLEIARAARHPVKFSGQAFIRVGSYKKKLKDFPEKERTLWHIFDQMRFEEGIAAEMSAVLDGYLMAGRVDALLGSDKPIAAKQLSNMTLLDGSLIETSVVVASKRDA
jgi:ATP-dependent DNA helicase RecG